ncbi:MAG: M55 family metallopeptidase [Firmicutes bacterium]|nr:M55 family metallopeptidase [Bacillota bacterium]
MKIYVSVDMEGIAGIVVREQLRRGEALYEEGRRLLTAEVNALVAAILASCATEIIVKDAHGTGFNFHVEHLHEGAEYVLGPSRMEKRFPGLDATFDGAMLIGYHAMAGTAEAVRDHSYVPTEWPSLTLNGRAVGEIALDALLFGIHEVPVLLVSGDDKACAEAREVLPGVVTYETKRAFGKHVAITRAPARVYRELPDIVARALDGRAARSPVAPLRWDGPYELVVKLAGTELADARYFDGVHAVRQDGTTALYRGADLLDVLARGL